MRQVEAQQRVVALGNLDGSFPVAVFLRQTREFVVENVGEALEEEQGEEVVLELGRVFFAADGAGGVPEHLLHWLCRRRGGFGLPASARDGGGGNRFRSRFALGQPSLRRQHLDHLPRRFLRLGDAAFPSIDSRKRDTELLSELFLSQVELGAKRPEECVRFSQMCHV